MGRDDGFLSAARDLTASLDSVPLPIALLDEQGVVRWQNHLSRARRGPRLGVHAAEIAAPEDRATVYSRLRQVLSSGNQAELTLRASTSEGESVIGRGSWSVASLRDQRRVVVVVTLSETARDGVPALEAPRPKLTLRQRDVLRLLAAGRATGEIAAALSLKTTTVRNHVANVLTALGAHSRLQAVVIARREGLLDE